MSREIDQLDSEPRDWALYTWQALIAYEVAAICLLCLEHTQIGLRSGSHALYYGTTISATCRLSWQLPRDGSTARLLCLEKSLIGRRTGLYTPCGCFNLTTRQQHRRRSLVSLKTFGRAVSNRTLGRDDYLNYACSRSCHWGAVATI